MNCLALTLLVLSAAPASAAANRKIAVPEFQGVNLTAELSRFYATEVARTLRNEGLDVVTAADVATVLGLERQKELLGCGDGSACMAELGSAFGCDLILSINLARLDDTYRGSLRVVSARDGTPLTDEAFEASGQRALADALERAAKRLAEKLKPPPPPLAARSLSWVPLAGAVALGVGAGISLGVAHADFARIPSSGGVDAANALAREGELTQTLGWTFVGVGSAALVTSVLMFVLGAPVENVTPSVSVSPAGASVGLRVVMP
ncbi:MAG: hypothetical protein QM817_35865 [Archangium sp.]